MLNDNQGKSLSQLIEELRTYQSELETQNEALRYSRIAAEGASERFESLFSKVPLALMVVDELGMVVQSNSMALRLFRPLEHDPPLNFLIPLVDAQHVSRVEQKFEQARREGTSEVTEVVFSRGSEGFFTGDLHMARIEYSQDELAHFICAIVDQTPLLSERHALTESASELKQRNSELRQSENRMAAIINSSLDAIICVGTDLHITVFNPAAATLFECTENEALNASLSRFLPDAIDIISATQAGNHTLLGEMKGLAATGKTLALEVSASCERHVLGNVTTVFARDLTARKAMERQRDTLEAQLRESQKMQAVGTMAGGIAHDFNNILGAILGNVELAKQDVDKNSNARISLTEIEKAGRRARDLVSQILAFSRNESKQRLPVSLKDVVLETIRLVQVTLPAGLDLKVDLAAEVPAILADSTRVQQALLNLCTNAVHAIGKQSGAISIQLETSHVAGLEAERLGLAQGLYAKLTVADSGEGMDKETLQRIFEPFFTTKEVGQGTGLGLAVVHGVMRTHSGSVDVRSTKGQGSTFTLYFPALELELPVEPIRDTDKTHPDASGEGKHVMYVDDDQALVFLIERALGRRGFQVSSFTDPRQAIEALRANPATYDLLVTDYNMPGFSGIDVLREAHLIRADLPVALASGYVTPEIEHAAMAEGARALIHKPNDVSELCDTMHRLMRNPLNA
jgi:two-component system cell cycle sensor histidine kinase/response regulator CckA